MTDAGLVDLYPRLIAVRSDVVLAAGLALTVLSVLARHGLAFTRWIPRIGIGAA